MLVNIRGENLIDSLMATHLQASLENELRVLVDCNPVTANKFSVGGIEA